MAADIILYDRNSDAMRNANRGMQMLVEGVRLLASQRDSMIRHRDGDGSQDIHYDLLATEGGFEAGDYASANAAARASFNEIDSLVGKLTTNASVADVAAAIAQAPAKHGIVV
jgi:phosphoribosylformylglycinamidine (FGAM) synthase-like amidotransferase family enzyme